MTQQISLKAARVNADMTIAQVSEIINVQPNSISAWERGISEISAERFKQLCDLYNIDWDYVKVPKTRK